jgi:hypothetical protein
MVQLKAGNIYYVPVRLLTALGAPVTGVLFTQPTVILYFNNGTSAPLTPGVSDWIEYSQGAYGLRLNPVTSIYGPLVVAVSGVSGANAFVGVYDVVQNLASDATAAAVASSTTSTATQALVQTCVNVLTGNWSINASTNVLYLFAPGVPIGTSGYIARFNLTDNNGATTSTNIYTRVSF